MPSIEIIIADIAAANDKEDMKQMKKTKIRIMEIKLIAYKCF